MQFHNSRSYFYNLFIELSKAYDYFVNIEDYVNKARIFCESFEELKSIQDLREAISVFQDKCNSEIEKIFILRILNDYMDIEYGKDFNGIFKAVYNQNVTTFNKEIKPFVTINYIPQDPFMPWDNEPDVLKWEIKEVHFIESNSNNEVILKDTSLEKSIKQIDWKANERSLPYLFVLLREYGFINEKHLFSFISKYFTVNGKPIKRVHLISNYKQADYESKNLNDLPPEIRDINIIFEKIDELNKMLKWLDSE